MVARGRDSSEAVDDNLDFGLFCLFHDFLEAVLTSKHLIRSLSASDCEGRGIWLAEFHFVHYFVQIGVVVTLKHSHQVQSSDSSLLVSVHGLFDFGEISSFDELAFLGIYLCSLVVNIHLVEDVVANALRVNNKAALSLLSQFIILL